MARRKRRREPKPDPQRIPFLNQLRERAEREEPLFNARDRGYDTRADTSRYDAGDEATGDETSD